MDAPNDQHFEPETHLLFCLYYEAWLYRMPNCSAAWYLDQHKEEIKAVAQALEWLYLLAEPDKKSVLGWRPTNYLVGRLVNPRRYILRSAKECASAADNEVFDGMIKAILDKGGGPAHMRDYVVLVLSYLGLIRCAKNGDVVPTSDLLRLIASRSDEEGLARWKRGSAGAVA